MTRLFGWSLIAVFVAWSTAAVVVSGTEAGAPYLVAAVMLAAGCWGLPRAESELKRIHLIERRSGEDASALGTHRHGSERFRDC